ncbi:MAG: PTS sugar transporter subunit IIA [Fusobacteriaceae bacterium]|jgi:fructose-specific phosphotransferase system IIA component|nr:PTS sugar transporter subunit IIA [Fusobacteriaceae bacterium]
MDIVKITDYITEDLINLKLKSTNKTEVLEELSDLLAKSDNVGENKTVVYKALISREKLGSTGIGKGVAVPHAKTDVIKGLTIAFGISENKIDFKSIDDEDVNIFFVFASPTKDSQTYLKVLARISRLIRESAFRKELLNCKSPKEVIESINKRESV